MGNKPVKATHDYYKYFDGPNYHLRSVKLPTQYPNVSEIPVQNSYPILYQNPYPNICECTPGCIQYVPIDQACDPNYSQYVPKDQTFGPNFSHYVPMHQTFAPNYNQCVPIHQTFGPNYSQNVPIDQTCGPYYSQFQAQPCIYQYVSNIC